MVDERLRRACSEGDFGEDCGCRRLLPQASRIVDEDSHALVARSRYATLARGGADAAVDLRDGQLALGQAFDLLEQPGRDRGREVHDRTVADSSARK
jgi:hypothetical protein